MKIVNPVAKFKFTALLSILIVFSLAMTYIRVFVASDYVLFIATECDSEDCFIYEDEEYALLKKYAKQVVTCKDEDCLIDKSCIEDGQCEYVDCDSRYVNDYFSSYTCN